MIEKLIEIFLNNVKITLSIGTYEYYKSHINNVLIVINKFNYQNISELMTDEFYNNFVLYEKNINVKNITINKRLKVLEKFLKFNSKCYKYVKLKEQYKTFDIIPESIFKNIINYIQKLDDSNISLNLKLTIMLLAETGLRANEIIHIEKLNINLDENNILLTTTKTNTDRYIFFKQYTKELIIKNLELNSKSKYLLFNWNSNILFNSNCLDHIIIRIKKDCKINHLSPHMFRHTFATMLINNGCPLFAVQKLLGHKSIKTTERYIHQNRGKIKEEFDKFFPNL